MSRYHEIAEDLRARIKRGDWGIGDKLPGISALQDEYKVERSLGTVRRAQQLLVADGMLRTEQGVGAFVTATEPVPQEADFNAMFAEIRDLANAGLTAVMLADLAGRDSKDTGTEDRGVSTEPIALADPFDVGDLLTREQRIERLQARFEQHRDDDGVPVLSEEELLVVVELLGELNAITNPGPGADTNPWGSLAAQMASRIYSRLGI